MIKNIGYFIYALFFHLFRLFPIREYKVFCVATHDASEEGNVGIVARQWKEREPSYRFVFMTRQDGIRHPFHFFIVLSYHMATSAYILEDNIFLPMAFLHFSKKVKIVQLWHGTGTIKKFGQSVNQGRLGRLEYKSNQKMTYLIVNSEYTRELYQKVFNVAMDKVKVLGMPRTDLLLDAHYLEQKGQKFFLEYPELKDKNIILYAPTFRDNESLNPTIHLDLERLSKNMPDDMVFMLRLHPHVAAYFNDDILKRYQGKIYNMSGYDNVTTLLYVANQLITDYSSIVFEYCVLNRPMLFYAYDLPLFQKDGRSFYETYREYVPGPVCETEDEVYEELLINIDRRCEMAVEFKNKNYQWLDGQATKRLLTLLLEQNGNEEL